MTITSDATVEVPRSEYESLKAEHERAYGRYGDFTDDEIDTIIELKSQAAVNQWITKVGRAQIESDLEITRQTAERNRVDGVRAMSAQVNLRQVMLEETEMRPVPEPDADMEALLR